MISSAFSRLSLGSLLLLFSGGLIARAQTDAPTPSAFGSRERVTPALVGIFYDLKQTQQRTPIPNHAKTYHSTIDGFLANGLNEHDLAGFFRAGLPLYATQISMPRMSASSAPNAFGVEAIVKPRYWIVHYKGQVAPPSDGTYRFLGCSDDILAVAINGKVVLTANYKNLPFAKLGWRSPFARDRAVPKKISRLEPEVIYGQWMDLKASEPVDIDIIVGERPGGFFLSWLFYEKQGAVYPDGPDGKPSRPLFQVAPRAPANGEYFADQTTWRCLD